MNETSKNTYKFGNFFFDGNKLALYYQDQLVKNISEKPLQVLAVLLQNANTLASHDEVIEQVWRNNSSGAGSDNIAQYINKLRKVLAEYEPTVKFIENIKGRGYMFVGKIESGETETSQDLPFLQSESSFVDKTDSQPPKKDRSYRKFMMPVYILVALIAVSAISLAAWNRMAKNDEQEIKRVVADSQKFESLGFI